MKAELHEPPALFGLELAMAVEAIEARGRRFEIRRSDDPRRPREGPDVVLAARYDADPVVLVVGATFGWPEDGA